MAENVRGGAGRKDEVGHTGIYPATGPYPEGDVPVITPGEINSGSTGSGEGPGVQQNDALKGIDRAPRLGNELDEPENDALGG